MNFVVSVNAANPPPKSKKLNDVKTSPSYTSLPLPHEITLKCISYIPRCNYPSLSLVCKNFHRFILSSELKVVRSLLQQTENVLYVALSSHCEESPIWYTLNKKPYKNESNNSDNQYKLVLFSSFPSLPLWGSSVIVIGHEIYVFGGCINGELTSNVFVIDCLHDTCRFLPSMRVPRGCAAFGVVDGQIYIIGGFTKTNSLANWIEVFDLKKQNWECFPRLCNEEMYKITLKSVVMNGKIYILDRNNSFIYDPKEDKWEKDMRLDKRWEVGSCVIDNMLYTSRFEHRKGVYRIRVYDPKIKVWRFVKGVEDLPQLHVSRRYRMVNHGGKLTILLNIGDNRETKIWCIKVALERRGEQGEIWGKVLWSSLVLTLENNSTIVQCLDVSI